VKVSRRTFVKNIVAPIIASGVSPLIVDAAQSIKKSQPDERRVMIYRAINGSPSANMAKVIELAGGAGKIFGEEDVVVVKPNAQWWNQGVPNLSALNELVRIIFDQPGFSGEVIIAENNHRGSSPEKTTGWATVFERNSDLPGVSNLNEVCQSLKGAYGNRFSVCHWIDVESGNKRTFGPGGGTGYVYCDGTGGVPLIACENARKGDDHRTSIMTYPIFSSDRGTLIDFKNGVWQKDSYSRQPLKFINLSALNHHSTYCGMTSAVKNYMGVTDLSGGPDPYERGRLTKDYYNFHSFPFNKWAPGPSPGMLGKEIGTFMQTIRKADLNICTAEWIGLSSRLDCPVVRTRAVLASADAVALDYHSAKYLLFPNSGISVHDPDASGGPLRQYLMKCSEAGGGVIDESSVKVISYDFGAKRLQKDDELVIKGKKEWGRDIRAIGKYMVVRYWRWP